MTHTAEAERRHLRGFALRQGRYKALLLDGDAVGPICHYIHLNPAQAGIVEPGALQTYYLVTR